MIPSKRVFSPKATSAEVFVPRVAQNFIYNRLTGSDIKLMAAATPVGGGQSPTKIGRLCSAVGA